MKKIIFTLLLSLIISFVHSTAFAGKNPKTKLKSELFETEPFQSDQINNLKKYRGNDPYALAVGLMSRPEKDDYETISQYQERLDKWSNKPLYGNVRIGDTIGIRGYFLSLQSNYDADTQTVTFNFDPDIQVTAENSTRPYLIIKSNHSTLKPVIGQTAMGIKFKYERKAFSEFGVQFDNLSHTNEKYVIKAPPEVARKGKLLWDVIYVGKLSDPYLIDEKSYHTPSLTERYEQAISSSGIVVNVSEIIIYGYEGSDYESLVRIPFN